MTPINKPISTEQFAYNLSYSGLGITIGVTGTVLWITLNLPKPNLPVWAAAVYFIMAIFLLTITCTVATTTPFSENTNDE